MNNLKVMATLTHPYIVKGGYVNKYGICVPRVTEILSKCIHADSLMYWANSLGFKGLSYKKTLSSAASIGSYAHDGIDHFLSTGEEFNNLMSPKESRKAYLSFRKWYEDISSSVQDFEVLMHEQSLVCDTFGGTLDGLYRINGKVYIVDYKTSNHVGFKYYLQIAAYLHMLREVHGITVDGCIILQLSKYSVDYTEYPLDFSIPEHNNFIMHCESTFLSLVDSYTRIMDNENTFNIITKGNNV